MTTWCAPTGKRIAALPVAQATTVRGLRPLASLFSPAGPFLRLSSEVPLGARSPRPAAEDALGPSFSSVLFTWAPMHPSIACVKTVDGALLLSVVGGTAPGAQFGLEVRRSGGQEDRSPTYNRRIPFYSTERSLEAACGLLNWLSLVWSGMASRAMEESKDARWAFTRGPRTVALDEAGLDPCEVWKSGYQPV
ncbi:hypothetical protein GWK47_043709 [Chionoecetes opilio]|uniref:Uncharacterized protein n=1 Tax=Chionoecetes opilio TaxID=41210 RepID=A0A8J5CYI5_CHIOP|nr:hypothetical protein GWK47_043709 [Chionoecetes opilio]